MEHLSTQKSVGGKRFSRASCDQGEPRHTLSLALLPLLLPPRYTDSPDACVGNEDLDFQSSVLPSRPFILGASRPPEAASQSSPPPLPFHRDRVPCGKTSGTQHSSWVRKYPLCAKSFKSTFLNNKDKMLMSICFTPFFSDLSNCSEFRPRKYGAPANPVPWCKPYLVHRMFSVNHSVIIFAFTRNSIVSPSFVGNIFFSFFLSLSESFYISLPFIYTVLKLHHSATRCGLFFPFCSSFIVFGTL